MKNPARILVPCRRGRVIIASDAHYWPGRPTTAHRALVQFIEKYRPEVVIMNGDVIDASTISRHPPIGWEKHPSLKEELAVAQDRLDEVEYVAREARLIWTLGNHDARFETRLASVLPEFKGVYGVHLKDHFPAWEPAWTVEVGGKRGAIVKHRFKGGMGAALNNALWSGRTVVTGHFHRLQVTPITDYSGTRFGVEGGMLAESPGPQFTGYTEDNPQNWRSGFVMLTFVNGRLLWPEIISVVKPGLVDFRGRLVKVAK